jgi:hypothetical protein
MGLHCYRRAYDLIAGDIRKRLRDKKDTVTKLRLFPPRNWKE